MGKRVAFDSSTSSFCLFETCLFLPVISLEDDSTGLDLLFLVKIPPILPGKDLDSEVEEIPGFESRLEDRGSACGELSANSVSFIGYTWLSENMTTDFRLSRSFNLLISWKWASRFFLALTIIWRQVYCAFFEILWNWSWESDFKCKWVVATAFESLGRFNSRSWSPKQSPFWYFMNGFPSE